MSSLQLVLNRKMGFVLAILGLVSVVVVTSFFVIHTIHKDTTTQIRNSLQSVLSQSYSTYNIWLDTQLMGVKRVSEHEEVLRLFNLLQNNSNLTAKSNLKKYLELRTKEQLADGYQLIALDGKIVIGSGLRKSTNSLLLDSNPQRFQKVLEGETVSIPPILEERGATPYDGKNLHRGYTFYFLSPVFDETNQVVAVLAMLKSIHGQLSSIVFNGRIGETGETYLLNGEGKMLSKSRYHDQLTNLGILAHGEDGLGYLRVAVPGSNELEHHMTTSSALTHMAQSVSDGVTGYNIKGYLDYRGEMVYGAWLWDESSGIGIATEIDKDEADRAYTKMTLSLFVLILLVTAAGISAIYFLSWLQAAREKDLLRIKSKLETEVKERTNELEQALQTLKTQATTDALTHLPNRRSFDENFDLAWQQCVRNNNELAVILLDVDFFKQYNDNYGHQAGDTCLATIGHALSETGLLRRPLDQVARYGGEEFVLVLADTNADYVHRVAEVVRKIIMDLMIPHDYRDDGENHISVSLGVASIVPTQYMSSESLVDLADKALYKAKQQGRNKVVMAEYRKQEVAPELKSVSFS